MEAQTLPWWKRALRAAIGNLRTGFGLFGKPQQQITSAIKQEPAQSIPPSEPEPEINIAEITAQRKKQSKLNRLKSAYKPKRLQSQSKHRK